MRVLLTGFGPFPGVGANPSELVVAALACAFQAEASLSPERASSAGTLAEAALPQSREPVELCAEVLPVAYAEADERVRRLLTGLCPDVVLMLGVAPRLDRLALERVALNLDDTPDRPDNNGDAPDGRAIEPDGPLAYASTLPLLTLRDRLRTEGIPATISNHAGTYLCNHVFYVARHVVQQTIPAARCGFIHIPLPRELNPESPGSVFSVDDLTRAVRRCIEIITEAA